MAVINSQGTTITYDAATIGGVISISGLDGTATDIDTTTLASTAKESRQGLQDFGTFQIDVFRDNDDAGQAACMTAMAAMSTKTMVVTLPSSTLNVATFSAYVKSFTMELGVDNVVRGKITFKISGAVVWS